MQARMGFTSCSMKKDQGHELQLQSRIEEQQVEVEQVEQRFEQAQQQVQGSFFEDWTLKMNIFFCKNKVD